MRQANKYMNFSLPRKGYENDADKKNSSMISITCSFSFACDLRGRMFIYDLLKADGILPLVEQEV